MGHMDRDNASLVAGHTDPAAAVDGVIGREEATAARLWAHWQACVDAREMPERRQLGRVQDRRRGEPPAPDAEWR